MGSILYAVAAILIVLWVIGFFVAHIGGSLIHALLVIALIVFVFQIVTGRRSV